MENFVFLKVKPEQYMLSTLRNCGILINVQFRVLLAGKNEANFARVFYDAAKLP